MKKIIFLSLIVLLFSAGCVTNSMYYWGKYSHTLYDSKKNPSEESKAKHKKSLKSIIEKSKRWGKKVPPGIYCEFAYCLYQEGDTEEANKYFELEKTTYPESSKFVDTIKNQANGGK